MCVRGPAVHVVGLDGLLQHLVHQKESKNSPKFFKKNRMLKNWTKKLKIQLEKSTD